MREGWIPPRIAVKFGLPSLKSVKSFLYTFYWFTISYFFNQMPWLLFCFSACFSVATVCFAQSFQLYGHYSREGGHISTLSVITTEKLFCIPAAILRCYSCHGYHCHDNTISGSCVWIKTSGCWEFNWTQNLCLDCPCILNTGTVFILYSRAHENGQLE